MANYPTSKDDATSLPNPTGASKQNNPDHGALHTAENAAIIALETKLGTGATTPTSNTLLLGTGAGTSAWSQATSAQLAASISDETGSGSVVFANTPTLITPKVDTIQEATLNNGVTVAGVNIKSGFLSGANLTAGTVGSTQVATGVPVQIVSTNYSAVATGTTTIPEDDTIPQNTEGDQYMTQAITPKSATNIIVIEVLAMSSNSNPNQDQIIALFQDTTVNALAATVAGFRETATSMMTGILKCSMLAGTTSSTTFKVRIGGQAAGTTTFNGQSGGRKFGAIPKSYIQITEYKA